MYREGREDGLISPRTLPDHYWVVTHDHMLDREWDWDEVSTYCDEIENEAFTVLNARPIYMRFNSDRPRANNLLRPAWGHVTRENVKAVEFTWCLLHEAEARDFRKHFKGRIKKKEWPAGLTDRQKIERFYDVVLLGR